MRDKVKATKRAAASKAAATRASGPRSDAAAAKKNENANGPDSTRGDSEEVDEEWAPSKVSLHCPEYIQATLLTGGEPIREYTRRRFVPCLRPCDGGVSAGPESSDTISVV